MNLLLCVICVSCVALCLGLVKPSEDREDQDFADHGSRAHCICKPTMRIELMESEGGRPICNNATVNWLLNTALERISKQTDWIHEMVQELKNLEEELSKGHDLLIANEKQIEETQTESNQLRDELEQRNQRISELEEKLRLMEEERKKWEQVRLENADDDSSNFQWKPPLQHTGNRPRDCSDVQESGMRYSGIYSIYPNSSSPDGVQVFCDLNTDGGRWTVIQRRQDGSESFERNWDSYRNGFGVLAKEFWLGNENIYSLTSQRSFSLRIDMIDFDSKDYFAVYNSFLIGNESDNYRLSLGDYNGNAGDSLSSHSGWGFSTLEADNDGSRSGNCSELYGGGGWWFAHCYDANLNGRYSDEDPAKRIVWFRLQSRNGPNPLRSTEMKIRP